MIVRHALDSFCTTHMFWIGGIVMRSSTRLRLTFIAALCTLVAMIGAAMFAQAGRGNQSLPPAIDSVANNAMTNPYRMLEHWPHLGDIKPGAAIGIVPDGKGGVWLQHRSVPAILHIDPSGNIVKTFDAVFASSHGFCQDQDGNFWAADSGPFNDSPD